MTNTNETQETNLFGEVEVSEYTKFVEKFKPKLTTDDCFTPPAVYRAVKSWALKRYGIDESRTRIIRPFKPNGDYEAEDYSGDCLVLDNPPFSFLAKIARFYQARQVPFFLFAPGLTLFTYGCIEGVTLVVGDAPITYENGAVVRTSFITNLSTEYGIEVAPSLRKAVDEAQGENDKPTLPRYTYPRECVTFSALTRTLACEEDYRIKVDSLYFVRALDAQRPHKKAIYGNGFLCSKRVAQELSERTRRAKEMGAEFAWELSEREQSIVDSLE